MSQTPTSSDFQYTAPPSKGMAIAGLVCAVLGCIPVVGIVGAILGIIAMKKAKSDPQRFGGAGMGLAAAIVGGVMTVLGCVGSIGVLLPGLAAARNEARRIKSGTQMQTIAGGLTQYAVDNKNWFPENGADLQARLSKYGVTADQFTVPGADPGATDSYIYVPGYRAVDSASPATFIILYENPQVVHRRTLNILYADAHVETVPVSELQRTIGSSATPTSVAPKPSSDSKRP